MNEKNQPSKKPPIVSSKSPILKKAKTIRMGLQARSTSPEAGKQKEKSSIPSGGKTIKTEPSLKTEPNKESKRPASDKKPEIKPVGKKSRIPTLQPMNPGDNVKKPSKKNPSHTTPPVPGQPPRSRAKVDPPPPVPPPPPGNEAAPIETTREYTEGKWTGSGEDRLKKSNKRTLGRFEFLVEMAHGGMATLYLARLRGPEKFEKLLAIKKIHDHLASQTKFVEMFLDEARIAALIHHPNVATIFDMGKVENSYFIAMEYVHGESLNEVIKTCLRQKHELPWSYAVWLVNQATNGLDAAHKLVSPDGNSLDVVHRDVSPHNILISYEGHVKVVDFGIAYAKERLTQTAHDVMKGKVAYMSPEQTEGVEPDCRSDIFSLGIVLFEAVCMQRLFKERTQAATIRRVSEGQIPKPRKVRSSIPAELERIILKALEKNPDDRYKTAGELSDDLEALLAEHGESVNPRKTAKLMDRLFHDRIKIKDRQIKAAIENASGATLKDIVGSRDTSLSSGSLNRVDMRRLNKKKKVALSLAAGVPIVLLLLFVMFKMSGPGETSEERPAFPTNGKAYQDNADAAHSENLSQKPDEDAEHKPDKTTLIEIKVLPPEAAVVFSFRGEKYKGSPLRLTVPSSNKPETIVVEADGYLSQPVIVVPAADTKIPVTLQPVKHTQMEPGESDKKKPGKKPGRRRRALRRKKKSKRTLLRGIEE